MGGKPAGVEDGKLAPCNVRGGEQVIERLLGGTAGLEAGGGTGGEARVGAGLREDGAAAGHQAQRAGADGHAGRGQRQADLARART